jgi:hypothetical protein
VAWLVALCTQRAVELAATRSRRSLTKSELIITELRADNSHLRQADVELIVATIFDLRLPLPYSARFFEIKTRWLGGFHIKPRVKSE